uniref:Amino acid transporter transmembrane domain-containing protein n=1 Tax=Oryza meridionalis TaxID=40149 RepID=A0A0E0DME4_9ORYZ
MWLLFSLLRTYSVIFRYVLGATETFLDAIPYDFSQESVTVVKNALVNGTSTASTATISTPSLHVLQVYGVIATILLCFIVFCGINIVNKVATVLLVPVLFSLLYSSLGVSIAASHNSPKGITGLSIITLRTTGVQKYQCTNNAGVPDPNGFIYWDFKISFDAVHIPAPALTKFINLGSNLGTFSAVYSRIVSVTENRSASLKETQCYIPIGTLSATLTTTARYLFSVFLFGAFATREELPTDRLLTATVAWPAPAVIYIGAALHSLTGAPRLLEAIANDVILPVLDYFKIWRRENLTQIPSTFESTINDCKALVVAKGLDEWPNEYLRQYGS